MSAHYHGAAHRSATPTIAISCQALNNNGGFERYVRMLVGALNRRAIRPTVYARKIDNSLPEAHMVDQAVVRVGFVPGKLRDALFAWRLGSRLAGDRPDVLITCNRSIQADIAVCGGTHPGYLAHIGREARPSDRLQIALERRTYASARWVIAHSPLMADELRRYYDVPAEKIVVLPPPTVSGQFSPVSEEARQALRRELGLPPDRVVFAFSSTSHERKGYEKLQAYFRSTDLPVCLMVAGRPVTPLDDRIHYVGYRRDIENVFRAADFTMIPSRYEPFGLVGIESVMCGTPLVIGDNVGCAAVLRDEAKIVFHQGDKASFTAAVESAVARARSGAARLPEPLATLSYDPSVDVHLDAVLALIERR